jgi:hypothetical protein
MSLYLCASVIAFAQSSEFCSPSNDTVSDTPSYFLGFQVTGENTIADKIYDAACESQVSVPEYWGVSESLGFVALSLVAFSVMVRLRVLRQNRFADPGTERENLSCP